MSTDPRVINEEEDAPDENRWTGEVQKVVLGSLEAGDVDGTLTSYALPPDLAERCPNLTQLYLWNLQGLTGLPPLPPGLRCLHIRGCTRLKSMGTLPAALDTLIVEGCDSLEQWPDVADGLPELSELVLGDQPLVDPVAVRRLVGAATKLRVLELSRMDKLDRLDSWAKDSLVDVRIKECPSFGDGAGKHGGLLRWPSGLRRLELVGTAVSSLPPLPRSLDYIDVQGCQRLRHLPEPFGHEDFCPRTVIIHGSTLELPSGLFGDRGENRAPEVLEHLAGERAPLHDVKVILIGNGRAGKTSLAKCLMGEAFDPKERSTHGIRLWSLDEFGFEPIDEPGTEAQARLNIWDFAGQDLFHNTHRLFYQSEAVYIVCETCAGGGADPSSDIDERADHELGWDREHDLAYWLDQIRSMGVAPGRTERAPLLYVRTKVDRDVEDVSRARSFMAERQESLDGLQVVEFDAKSKRGLNDVAAWIRSATAAVLGARGRRELRVEALDVRAEIQGMVDENSTEQAKAEAERRVPRPSHATMARTKFEGIVRSHVSTGRYRERPELLLDLFHRGGLLYHDSHRLPETVLLDQRWAISAIYTAFDRRDGWPELLARGGRCSRADLERWGWGRLGVGEEQLNLFTQLMVSCGTMFPLGDSVGGRTQEYVVPMALPPYDDYRERIAREMRGGLDETRVLHIENSALGRDAVLDLVAQLGTRWGRSALLWSFGGQFRSFRYEWDDRDEQQALMHLNWEQLPSFGAYGGRLELRLFGCDESFLAAVLNLIRDLPAFSEVEVPVVEVAVDSELEQLRTPPRAEDPSRVGAHEAAEEGRNCLEIGISFSGDGADADLDWTELPAESIERWPRALAKFLRGRGFKVEDYLYERQRDAHEKTTGRREYLDQVCSRDFVYVFLSEKYLRSPWCMYEFMGVFDRFEGRHEPGQVSVAAIGNSYFSQTAPQQDAGAPEDQFADYWNQWVGGEIEKVRDKARRVHRGQATFIQEKSILDRLGYGPWVECVQNTARFEEIFGALWGGWSIDRLPTPVEIAKVEDLAQSAEKSLARQELLLDIAASLFSRDTDRAQRIFVLAVLGCDPDGQPEGLRAALERELPTVELNRIRKSVLAELDEAVRKGRKINTWQEFASLVVESSLPPDRKRRRDRHPG